jgi:hypothetical protein
MAQCSGVFPYLSRLTMLPPDSTSIRHTAKLPNSAAEVYPQAKQSQAKKESSLRRVRSSNLNLACCLATFVHAWLAELL